MIILQISKKLFYQHKKIHNPLGLFKTKTFNLVVHKQQNKLLRFNFVALNDFRIKFTVNFITVYIVKKEITQLVAHVL